jgi:diamine N-acetyltransferase
MVKFISAPVKTFTALGNSSSSDFSQQVTLNCLLTKINSSDLEKLQNLCRQTFTETFAWGNTVENLNNYLDSAFSTDLLNQEILNPDCELFFADYGNQTAGYIKINLGIAQNEYKDRNSLEIERLYVAKEFQGRGIGKALLEKAVEIACAKKLDFVWLGVWEKNEKAIAFYEKNGFQPCGSHFFMVGDDRQNDILMKMDVPCQSG